MMIVDPFRSEELIQEVITASPIRDNAGTVGILP
jgi:hypothetical protein